MKTNLLAAMKQNKKKLSTNWFGCGGCLRWWWFDCGNLNRDDVGRAAESIGFVNSSEGNKVSGVLGGAGNL